MRRVIFLDRDGTINVDHGFVYKAKKLDFIPGSVEGLRLLQLKGYELIIVTNQSGIGRGRYSESDFEAFTDHFLSLLKEDGVVFSDVLYCPHTSLDGCSCRKPFLGLVKKLVPELDIAKSFVIGDKTSDIRFASNLGVRSILVKTGKAGSDKEYEDAPWFVAENLLESAKKIINSSQ